MAQGVGFEKDGLTIRRITLDGRQETLEVDWTLTSVAGPVFRPCERSK
jgi:hypothetical protein